VTAQKNRLIYFQDDSCHFNKVPPCRFDAGAFLYKMKKLIDVKELSEVVSLSERKIHTLVKKRVISCIRISYRCIRYNPEKVIAELERHYGEEST